MKTISLCMIVKDEEENLEKCLNSIAEVVDEIIIVDTGSTDGTVDIAEEYTNNIYYYKWDFDFSKARNFSFKKASKEFIFWLDADDIVLKDDLQKFKELKELLDDDIGVVAMNYNYSFDETGNVDLSFYRERLIRRDLEPTWYEPVHEYIDIDEKIYTSDINITHNKTKPDVSRNINIYKKYLQAGNELSVRGMVYYGMELQANNFLHEAIMYYEKFLNSIGSWTEDCEWATLQMGICYQRLGEHQKAIKALLASLEKCVPKGAIYCEIGNSFMHLKDYDKAMFWFELAIATNDAQSDLGYRLNIYHDYLPNYQLSICHYIKGDLDSAMFYNNEALKAKPTDHNAQKNKALFEKMIGRIKNSGE